MEGAGDSMRERERERGEKELWKLSSAEKTGRKFKLREEEGKEREWRRVKIR